MFFDLQTLCFTSGTHLAVVCHDIDNKYILVDVSHELEISLIYFIHTLT